MELNSDIIIIGAGPAGLAAANRASEHGLDTVLFEKQYEIGYPVRTSGGSYIADMKEFRIPSKFYNPIRKVIFGTFKSNIEFCYKKDTACILDTRSIYQYLANRAAEKGCNIQVGVDAKDIMFDGSNVTGVKVVRAGREVTARSKIVIDCSGFSAISARKFKMLGKGPARFGSGVEYEAYVEHVDKRTAMLFVGSEVAPTGYVWVFPLSDHKVRIGVGVTKPDSKLSPLPLLDNLIAKRPAILEDLGRITPTEMHSGVIPVEPVINKVTTNGLILVGDAACQANPVVGEGIRPALRFGFLAADVSAKAIEHSNMSLLQVYEKESAKAAKHNKIGLMLQRNMANYSDKEWEKGIHKLGKLSEKDFLNLMKADFSNKNLLKILAKSPSFFIKQALK